MDTSTVDSRADTLGRRVVPRQFRSLEDKLRIIDEARVSGASVAAVARRHGVNANLVFAWMRLQGQGLLAGRTRRSTPALFPTLTAAGYEELSFRGAARGCGGGSEGACI